MVTVRHVMTFLEDLAPSMLAESWDNVGLLVGHPGAPVQQLMTCLTVTPESVQEAVARQANLIVTHHPLPFHALKRLTTQSTTGRMLLRLIEQNIAIYSPHTAFDSAARGINQQLAEALQLQEIAPLMAIEDAPLGAGAGRIGTRAAPTRLSELAIGLKAFLAIDHLWLVGSPDATVQRVAVACGAAGQFLDAARDAACQLLVLGETNFHTCLEARAAGIALLLTGHFASERFAVETLADRLRTHFSALTVWASESESDPLQEF